MEGMDVDAPDNEEAACDMDQLESYFARRGQYEEAAMVNGAGRRMREDSEEIARLRAENEKLRADLVWAVRNNAAEDDASSLLLVWTGADGRRCVRQFDGTDAGLLDAVRRAREERSDGL